MSIWVPFKHNASTKVGNSLTCPWCDSTALRKVDTQPPDRVFYRCKKCNKLICYIATPMDVDAPQRLAHSENNPYGHFRRGMGRNITLPGLGKFKISGIKQISH